MEAPSLAALLDACRPGEPALPASLGDALVQRGAVPPEQHAAELEWLARMREAGRLEAGVAQQVVDRLRALQAGAPMDAGEAGDQATVVKSGRPPADTTGVAPPAWAPADQATVVKPAARPPQSQTHTPATQTTGSTDASGWQHLAAAAAAAAASDHATVGSVLKGRFVLEREIGRGGMGVVFLARDERKVEARDRDPYVALKVLNDEFRRHPDSLIALQRESRRSQQLAHDNIVRVYDFDKDGTIVFMTMEYVDGADLKTLIRERVCNGMPLAKARPLIEGMARALKRAHDAGVVHSDFKPGNVMVTREGVAKVFDFGIARAGKQPGDSGEDQTVFDAARLGALTPAYASLEMIEGKPPQPTDDLYALGCVAFELLTGKHPFGRASAETALRERRRPPPVPGLTTRQYRVLCEAVAFTGDKRLKSADLLIEGLREIGLRERVGRPLAYALAAVALLLAAGWFAFGQLRARRVAEVAARLQPDNPRRYANEAEAAAALGRLGEGERKQLMLEQGDLVQGFLLDRVDTYWNPARGRRDYAAAERVLALPGRLHLYLPRVDIKRIAVEKERRDLESPKAAAASPAPVRPPAAAMGDAVRDPSPAPVRTPVQATDGPASKLPAQPSSDTPADRMQAVAAGLLREGERNFGQQDYSAAIANARAALQVDPGNAAAKRLLRRAQQAQRQAMSSISIN